MTTVSLSPQSRRHSGGARISVFRIAATTLLLLEAAASQTRVRFDEAWWRSMDQNEHWDFIYGFTDCGPAIRSGLNMAQYDEFIYEHVDNTANSVPRLIRLASHKIKALRPLPGGERWPGRHGFNNGDLWGDNADDGRAWVEGYLACEHRAIYVPAVDRYVSLLIRHYQNPKRHLDNLADVLEPLLPAKNTLPTQ